MLTGAERMAQTSEHIAAETDFGLFRRLIDFALQPAPPGFGLAKFGNRLLQHLTVYGAILAAAVYGCLFVSAPLETALISVLAVAIGSALVLLFSSPAQRLRRAMEG